MLATYNTCAIRQCKRTCQFQTQRLRVESAEGWQLDSHVYGDFPDHNEILFISWIASAMQKRHFNFLSDSGEIIVAANTVTSDHVMVIRNTLFLTYDLLGVWC